MSFALVLGFLQIVYAMVLRIIHLLQCQGIKPALMPLSYLLMFVGAIVWGTHTNAMGIGIANFCVGKLKLGQMILLVPELAGECICLGGIALLFIFNNPGKNIFLKLPLGLWEFYNYATGILGDMLSYIRLFALGLCGGLLASTFNSLAMGFITHNGVVNFFSPMVIFTILLLLAGHGLNFGLALVGAFVHPIRLTFVEFYKNLSFSGGGKPYVPFEKVQPE
jgi:V/A-type H+/Na+-transporting ATPase subunit I